MQQELWHVLLAAALCFCASAGAQPAAPDPIVCDRDVRNTLAPFVERELSELRGFAFSKRQVDQLAQYLESPEGVALWAGATAESRRQLSEAASRAAATSSATVAHLPFSASTRYLFEEQLALDCAKVTHLVAQMTAPGFAQFLAVRAQVAAVAASWYARGMFSKLAKESPPFASDDSRSAALAGAPRPKGSKRTVAAAKEIASAGTQVEFDTLLRQRDLLNAELTLRQQDWLLTGAALAAPSSLRQAAIETLTDATTQSVLRDSVYAAFHLAVAVTAHKMEARLLQDYPHIEPLSRNVSKAWAGDWLRPAAVAPAPKRQPLEAAGKAPIPGPEDSAPKGEAAPVNPATKK